MPSRDEPAAHGAPEHTLWRAPFSTIIVSVAIIVTVVAILYNIHRRCSKRHRTYVRKFLSEMLFSFSITQGRLPSSQIVIPVESNLLKLKPGEEIRVTNDPSAGPYKKLVGEVILGPRHNSTMIKVRLKHWLAKNGVVATLPAFCIERLQDIAETEIEEENGSKKQHKLKKLEKQQEEQQGQQLKKDEDAEDYSEYEYSESDIDSGSEPEPQQEQREETELQKVAAELKAVRKQIKKLLQNRGRSLEEQREVRLLAAQVGKLQQKESILIATEDAVEEPDKVAHRLEIVKLPPIALQKMDTHALCRMCDQKGISRQHVEGRADLLVLLGAAEATAKQKERRDERRYHQESRARRNKRRRDMLESHKSHKGGPLVFTTS